MHTPHTIQDYPVRAIGHHALGARHARRRRWLGLGLIVAGSVWLCLRLAGWVSDVPAPLDWMTATIGLVERFSTGVLAL
jgi:hypothetical protein